MLDASNDGRLSVRELRSARARLARFDQNDDGVVLSDEIPARYQLTVLSGQTTYNPVQGSGFGQGVGYRLATSPPASHGPVWFRKMDRNLDGDVSRREFLGPPGHFGNIDTDGDGLIDLTEAEQADMRFRDTSARRP